MDGPRADASRLMTAPKIAELTGVSPNTVRSWTHRDPPLPSVALPDGTRGFLWQDLLDFCRSNQHLRGARKILDRVTLESRSEAMIDGVANDLGVESLRAIARDLRTAALSSVNVALTAVRQAEEVAKAHREQLEHIQVMLAAYDSALSNVTAPTTPHD